VVVAGLIAAAVSGAPSTTWTLVRGGDVLEGARAAGALVLPWERRAAVLLAAAVPVHLALSLGWAALLARVLPPRREPLWGALAGLAIATLDLGVIGRRIAAIRALDQPAQWADHLAYGATVGAVLRARRR
jgi:hypothetical protein